MPGQLEHSGAGYIGSPVQIRLVTIPELRADAQWILAPSEPGAMSNAIVHVDATRINGELGRLEWEAEAVGDATAFGKVRLDAVVRAYDTQNNELIAAPLSTERTDAGILGGEFQPNPNTERMEYVCIVEITASDTTPGDIGIGQFAIRLI